MAQTPKQKEYQRQYREKNRDRIRAYQKAWVEANPDKRKAYVARHAAKNPEREKARRQEYYRQNRERILADRRRYSQENKDKIRAYRQRTKSERRHYFRALIYGIPKEQFLALFEAQGGACAICSRALELEGPRSDQPHLDHCHETGKVRGILCVKCNAGLGQFKDNPASLERAASYLRAFLGGPS